MAATNTITDTRYQGLVALGHGPGSMATMERKRLLAKLALTEPQNKSLSDLYSLANEKPWPKPGFFPIP